MARTNVNLVGLAAPWQAHIGQPWVASGVSTASFVVKNAPGVFGGIEVIATDTGGDIDIIVWDSPDSTLTSDERLCRVTIPATTANTMETFGDLASPGIQAKNGIYVQVVAGDAQVYVFYR